jgi:hypothetical protein
VIGRLLTTGAAKRSGPAVPEEVLAVLSESGPNGSGPDQSGVDQSGPDQSSEKWEGEAVAPLSGR